MRGQLAIEFVFLVAVAFLILLVYTASTSRDLSRAVSAKEFALVKDLGFSLQSEINRVGSLEDGYQREFNLPATLEGFKYDTSIKSNILIVNTTNYEYTVSVLPVVGNFSKGYNKITKLSGVISINQ